MGESSRQEPRVNQADVWLQKPALGFNRLMQVPDKIQKSLKVHFGRFLNRDGAGRLVSAETLSDKVEEPCSAAAAELVLKVAGLKTKDSLSFLK